MRAGWTAYSLALLALAPHRFFARLARVGWYGDMLYAWADGLGLEATGRVLEVGCSAGALSGHLARSGRRVTGIDRSRRAIRHARATHGTGLAAPRFLRGDVRALPIANAAFDATLAASLINIVPDPLQVVAEMARVTAPGATVSCLFPTPRMDRMSARRFVWRHRLSGLDAQLLVLWATLARKLEPETAERLLGAAQLTNISSVHYLDGMVCAVLGYKSVTRAASAAT